MSQRFWRSGALMVLTLMLSACGKATPPAANNVPTQPAENATPPATTQNTNTEGTGAQPPMPVTPSQPTPVAPVETPTVAAAATFSEAAYLGDKLAGLVVLHPRKVTTWPVYKMLREAGALAEVERELEELKVQPETIERVTLILDQTTIDETARSAGLEVPEGDAPPANRAVKQMKDQLRQIGLGFHNYHDTFTAFPRADGDASGERTGLSWRVHLLPFLGEFELYSKFHMDEPWDSPHNKPLIEELPDCYRTPGVTDAGKTAFHVFTGAATPFHGKQGTPIASFIDGTSQTLLVVVAGAETADVWTKPGGLVFDAEAPKKALGSLGDQPLLALLADGSVFVLNQDLKDETFANLVQHQDRTALGEFGKPTKFGGNQPVPAMIVQLTAPPDRDHVLMSLLYEAKEETFEGQTLHQNETSCVWFPDEKTIVCGPIQSVRQMVTTKQSGKPGNASVISQLNLAADVTMAFDVESQAALVQQGVQLNPMLGLASQLKGVALQLSVTGKPGDKLLELVATTTNEQSAGTIYQLAQAGLAQGQSTLNDLPPATEATEPLQTLAVSIAKSATLKQNGARIEFTAAVPDGFDQLPKLLQPAVEQAKAAAERTRRRNDLKQLGLAFHNYYDTFQGFPGAGWSGAAADPNKEKASLSWRVYLLPYLDQAPLYNEFKLDEPWDSDHNKILIEKMPKLFQTPGVTEPGKTSIHVFTGPGAPFEKRETPKFQQFTDGTSNTILVVQAGADKAEIWTKPGGLDFDPKNPLAALGTIAEETFRVLICDGSVREVPKTIPAETLRRLIQYQDGEPVGDF